MVIGINCLNIDPEYMGGVKSFTLGLIGGFSEIETIHRFKIFASPENAGIFKHFESSPNICVKIIPNSNPKWKRRIIWHAGAFDIPFLNKFLDSILYRKLAKKLDCEADIIYFPNTVLFPYCCRKPKVLSMHDIQHVHFPEFFTTDQIKRRRIQYGMSVKNTNYMQASSAFIKQDFIAYFKSLNDSNTVILNEGVDIQLFSMPSGTDVKSKYGLPERFLFYPAQLWPHKNHISILQALVLLKQKGITIPLVLTGAKYEAGDSILEFIRTHNLDQVYYLGKIPFQDIIALHQSARFMITAVLYESSSIPILEAAAAGTPIIASNTPPNVELQSILKINMFSPLDTTGLSDLLQKIWDDDTLIRLQAETNRKNIDYFSWRNIAVRYLNFFKTISHAAA